MTNPSIASDLIERLLSEVVLQDDTGRTVMVDMGEGPIEVPYGGKTVMRRNPDGPEAAEALSQLTREVDVLREAIEPFDEAFGEDCDDDFGDEMPAIVTIGQRTTLYALTLGDFRRLRIALSRSSGRVSDEG